MDILSNLVGNNAIVASAVILILAYIFIAAEKIPKVTIALIGAALTMFLGLVSVNKFLPDGSLDSHYFINFVDFNVVILLVSMMIVVNISSKTGIFNWVANELLKLTKGHPVLILIVLALFTAVVSAFLDNVTTVILILPVTFYIAQKLDIHPEPYLITEILASNIGGTATLIGDPPNIIIGSAAGFSFLTFLKELTGIVILILAIVTFVMFLLFRKHLKATPEKMAEISKLDNSNTISNYPRMYLSLAVLSVVIIGFITHDMTKIPASLCALTGACVLLLFDNPKHILREVEWNTIFFFMGLFIIIGGLEASGGIALMAKWLLNVTHGSETATAMVILWGSGILSGIIDNIPYTVTMAPMIANIQSVMGAEYAHPLWWCLSLGACFGGNLTIIGAAANVIVSESASAYGYPISFMKYLMYGAATVLISLTASSVYIYFRFLIH